MFNKVLILGGRGVLGQQLTDKLSEKFNSVLSPSKNIIDITNYSELKKNIIDYRPNIIINASAINFVDKIETESDWYEIAKKVNGLAVGELAKISQELNIPLIHFSSDYVFSGHKQQGYVEIDEPEPINKYGETKLLGEELLKANTDKYYLIRLSRLFGKMSKSQQAKKSFVDIMLWLVQEQKKTSLEVVDEEYTGPTYSADLSDFVWNLIESKADYGIYHGSNTGACTWYGWAREIFKLKNLSVNLKPVKAEVFPRPAKRPKYSTLLNTKTKAQPTWQDALQRFLLI